MAAKALPEGIIAIVCDDASHAKPVTVAHFYPLRGVEGHWQEWTNRGGRLTGVTLVDNEPPAPGVRDYRGRDARQQYPLKCRKCRMSVPARQEKLFPALSAVAEHLSRISLTELAAILKRIST